MSIPVSDSYSCASGGVIAAGRNYLSPRVALLGDSLTDPAYGLSSCYWLNGLNGGKLQVVNNAGVSGNTVANVLARVDNAYSDGNSATRGLSGLGTLGYIVIRIGTNDDRNSTSIASLSVNWAILLNKLATYAGRVVILAVPPIVTPSFNNLVIQYNAWLSDFAAANPSKFTFIDDCINVRDGSNVQIASFFIGDGIHFNGSGVMQVGIDGAAAFGALVGNYASPLALAGDVYPAKSQWFPNPAIAGTGGSASSGFTGTVANNLSISGYGGGIAGTCLIVAADAGDPNTTPWQRVSPTQVTTTGGGEAIRMSSTLAGRTITTNDPATLDLAIEIRLNGFDTNYFSRLNAWVQGSSGSLTPGAALLLGGGVKSQSAILRQTMPRNNAAAQSSAVLYFDATISANHSGAMGSFDFRNVTVRG